MAVRIPPIAGRLRTTVHTASIAMAAQPSHRGLFDIGEHPVQHISTERGRNPAYWLPVRSRAGDNPLFAGFDNVQPERHAGHVSLTAFPERFCHLVGGQARGV